jgi:4-carboxymuconolactone decarboxylase
VTRLDRFDPRTLTEAQHQLYRDITQGPRAAGPQHFPLSDDAGGLHGPFNAFLLSPDLGRALQQVGAAIRYQSALTPRIREMAILAVAAHWNSEFEWFAHERVGRAVGVTEDELEHLRTCAPLSLTDPNEATALLAVRELLQGDMPDGTYERVVAQIGEAGLFELSTLVGYYATLALQMRVFRVTEPVRVTARGST